MKFPFPCDLSFFGGSSLSLVQASRPTRAAKLMDSDRRHLIPDRLSTCRLPLSGSSSSRFSSPFLCAVSAANFDLP